MHDVPCLPLDPELVEAAAVSKACADSAARLGQQGQLLVFHGKLACPD